MRYEGIRWKDQFPQENRYYETDNGILYCGDCLKIMRELSKESVDLALTDPPYEISTNGGGIMNRRAYLKDVRDAGLSREVNYDFLAGFENWLVFCSKKQLLPLLRVAEERKNCNWDILMMLKKNPPPLVNNTFLPDTEYIVFSRQKNRLFGKYKDRHKYMEIIVKRRYGNIHPTVKPLEVISWLLKVSSQEGELILDPFLGSGTTAIACEQLGRKWIGIETNREYCEVAKKRLMEKEGMV